MLAARRFRVAVSALASLAFLASTVQVVDASYNPQHIVLGRNGQVVDVDPSLYFHDRKMKSAATERAGEEDGLSRAAAGANPRQMDRKPRKQEHDVMRVARVPFHKREDEAAVSQTNVPEKMLLDLQTELRSRDAKENHHDQQQQQSVESNPLDLDHERASVVFADQEMLEMDDDEFSQIPSSFGIPVEAPEVPLEQVEELLESDLPGVQGSIVFAELSCLFVAFIGYLVYSIPLWTRFSRGQKWCLIVAFSAASLYQFAALSWYLDVVSADLMLGLSSLITRMISLGMVPITTTSFMGRSRAACPEQELGQQRVATITSSSSTRSARHHHPRARSG